MAITTNNSTLKYYNQDISVSLPTVQKLRSFKDLEDDWHFGEGISIEEQRIADAIILHNVAFSYGFINTGAFPGIDGEIRLTIYFHKHYLEFTIETNNKITYVYEKSGNELIYEENLSLKEAKEKIILFKENICVLSESFMKATMTQSLKDFKVWPSEVPEIKYPLSTKSALKVAQGQSVNILNISTLSQQSVATPIYSGSS